MRKEHFYGGKKASRTEAAEKYIGQAENVGYREFPWCKRWVPIGEERRAMVKFL